MVALGFGKKSSESESDSCGDCSVSLGFRMILFVTMGTSGGVRFFHHRRTCSESEWSGRGESGCGGGEEGEERGEEGDECREGECVGLGVLETRELRGERE